ncbi:MAG: TIGR04282 family arsenosugar biosynthesis glycosyltransferase [Desulfobulbaceae bacterium]|jgi:rSAM/selenodomain-associated transferase 1
MVQQTPLREEILVFTRYPLPGKVKTRLIPRLGEEQATAVHACLAERTIAAARSLLHDRDAGLSLWYTGGTRQQMRAWIGEGITLAEQFGNGLGQRMAAAFRASWARGTERAVLIGTDCPELNAPLLARALDHLRDYEMVIGPARDGGYYLIGLRRETEPRMATLFNGIAWGSADTFRRTMDRARLAGLTTATLTELHDIDRPEDLRHLRDCPDAE